MLKSLSFLVLASLVVNAAPAAALTFRWGGGGVTGPIVSGPVLAPVGPSKPAYPSVVVTSPRTPQLGVVFGWYNTSAASGATLYRSTANGPYTAVATSNIALTANTNSTIRDNTPPLDEQACYRVTVVDSSGYGATSDVQCVLTPDGRSRPLWRATLRVEVATVSDAGTDSAVHVRLNSPTGIGYTPSGNETWIDTPRDDFEAGTTRDYELLLKRIGGDITDVKMVAMLVEGDDAVCVRRAELILNEEIMFSVDYGNASCRWVSQGNQLTITRAELRASPAWPNVTTPPPPNVAYDLMDIAATTAVGDALHGKDVYFRDTSTNPNATTTSGTRRVYEWDVGSYGAPLKLQAELLTDTTCEAGVQKGHIFVGTTDVDAASWLWLIAPISEALVEAFEPSIPSLFSREVNLGPCSLDYHLCFTSSGLRPQAGGCAP